MEYAREVVPTDDYIILISNDDSIFMAYSLIIIEKETLKKKYSEFQDGQNISFLGTM
jgi:hypothetical protein